MEQIVVKGFVVVYEIGGEPRIVSGCTADEAEGIADSVRRSYGKVQIIMEADEFEKLVMNGIADL